MPRTVKIWQVNESYDMANSDIFLPSKAAMLAYVKEAYNCRGPGVLNEFKMLTWETDSATDEGRHVTARQLEVEVSKDGICHALTHYPAR